jgi:putative nucleotidyltransferase with HDIG domain
MTYEAIEKLLPEVKQIADKDLQRKVLRTWLLAVEKGRWARIDDIPFTLLIPDVGISLLEHTRTVTRMANSIGRVLGGVNLDYLIAGGLTHDVGKLLEYGRRGKKIAKSVHGMVRHPVSGYALGVEAGLPEEVCHIIAAHSVEGESMTRSKEAIIVNHCDFIQFEIVKSLK